MGKPNEKESKTPSKPAKTTFQKLNPTKYLKYWAIPIALFVACFHCLHLYASHENQMFFTEIKEVEREISFRTEQGLYYNAFKTIINSNSITQGIKQLMSDKTLEYPHTLNLIERLNIYQEIFFGVTYRVIFKHFLTVAPIQFYLYSIFYLQILQVFSIFLTTYCLTDMDGVAGVLSAVAFVVNKIDTTRVESTAPLRESFALQCV